MFEVRKLTTLRVVLGICAGVLIGLPAAGQKQEDPSGSAALRHAHRRARRESNASRQARIARTIEDTYSHKYEVVGGGGYLRWRSGEYTKRNNEVSWSAQAGYYLSPRFAVVGAAQGSFGNAKPLQGEGSNNFNIQAPNPQINEYFFTGGANYRFVRGEKYALSAQGTGGVVWGIFSGGAKGLAGTNLGLWNDGFRPAFTIALNADYNVYPNIALRFSPTYTATTFTSPAGGSVQSNLGFNAGVVYRFGRQK